MSPWTIRTLSGSEAAASVGVLADLLSDCVDGGASVSFMWPLAREKAIAFWHGVAERVASEATVLLVAQTEDGSVIGTVQLLLAVPENQPHRGEIAKMLVHRTARRRGIAQELLSAAEREARVRGRSLLVLDTVTGGGAERLYEGAGWQRVGVIPNYALMPDGALCSTTIFFKQL